MHLFPNPQRGMTPKLIIQRYPLTTVRDGLAPGRREFTPTGERTGEQGCELRVGETFEEALRHGHAGGHEDAGGL